MSYEKLIAIEGTHLNTINTHRSNLALKGLMNVESVQSKLAGPVFLMFTHVCNKGIGANHNDCELTSECIEYMDEKTWEALCKKRVDDEENKYDPILKQEFIMILPDNINVLNPKSLLDHRIIFPYSPNFVNPHCLKYIETYGLDTSIRDGISKDFRRSGYTNLVDAVNSLGSNRMMNDWQVNDYLDRLYFGEQM